MLRILLLLLFISVPGYAGTDNLTNYILTLNPYLKKEFAKQVAKEVSIQAKKFGLDPKVSLEIAMLESSFDLNAVSGTGDYGMFQVNLRTVQDLGIPIPSLGTLRGQVRAHMIILKHKIDTCEKSIKLLNDKIPEWTCYHSYTLKHRANYYTRYLKLFAKK